MQLAVHGLNYALWLVGEETVSVMGYARNLHCGHSLEGEDVVASAGELESGALITMESGYSSTGNSLEIYGTEGTLMCGRRRSTEVALSRDFSGELIEYRVDGAPEHPLCVTPDDFGEEAERIAAERNGNRTFAKAILSGEPFDTPAEIGMRDVAVCQAVYRSAETGRRVRVSELIEEAGA